MSIGFNVKAAVDARFSARTYEKRAVESDLRKKLEIYAASLENPLGPKVRFEFIDKKTAPNGEKLGTYGFINGASLFVGAAVPNENFAAEALGYDFERLILYAASLGLGTCWLGGTFNKSAFADNMKLESNERFPAVSPVGYPKNQRVVERLFRLKLKADNRLPWESIFFDGCCDKPLTAERAGEYAFPLEMLRLAPSAENKQPWRVVFDGKAFHFLAYGIPDDSINDIRMKRIDLGIAVCHFHLAAIEKGLKGKLERIENLPFSLPENTAYITSYTII